MISNLFHQVHINPFASPWPQLTSMWQGLTGSQSEASSPKESTAAIPQALRVLVLEDNLDLARVVGLLLAKMGHQPAVAHRGGDALRLLEKEQFHLALVDIDLPDSTGFEVVAKALAQGKLQGTKIIFCSGNPSEDRVGMAGHFPGSVFLPKPFGVHDLSTVILKLFRP